MSANTPPVLPHFIANAHVQSSSASCRVNTNPGTGEPIASIPLDDTAAAESAVQAAAAAFPSWSSTPVGDRIQPLFKYKSILEKHVDELAEIMRRACPDDGSDTAADRGLIIILQDRRRGRCGDRLLG